MPSPVPDVINRYFEADARRDIDAIVALFADNAVVGDEGETWRGISKIRAWREGPNSLFLITLANRVRIRRLQAAKSSGLK